MTRTRPGTRTLASLLSLSLCLSLLSSLLSGVAAAKKDKPEISETTFSSIPSGLFYFDDSDVVMATDPRPGIVYRSIDAGKNWAAVKDITEGMVREILYHPFDNRVAVAVGLETEHWISRDRGESWTGFSTVFPAVMNRSPIAFHAGDSERMIFHVADCLLEIFDCTEKVGLCFSFRFC